MNDNSTLEIAHKLDALIPAANSNLCIEYVLFTAACLITVMVVVPFLFKTFCKSAYLYKDTTPMTLHKVLILFPPVMSCWNLLKVIGNPRVLPVLFSVLLILFALWNSRWLYRLKVRGCVGTIAFFWAYAAFHQWEWLKAIDISGADTMSVPARYIRLCMNDYYVVKAMSITAVLVVITLIMAVYFYKRRFIFQPGKLSSFLKCSYCGKTIEKGDAYCRNCGTLLSVNPLYSPVRKILDTKKYCEKCGGMIVKQLECCPKCDPNKKLNTTWDKLKEAMKNNIVYLILMVIFYFVMWGPILVSPQRILPANVEDAQMAVFEKYADLRNDPKLAEDSDWINGFHEDLEYLYLMDSKWAYVARRSFRGDALLFYSQYAEASYDQMRALEELWRASLERDYEKIASLEDEFRRTITNQQQASSYAMLHQPEMDLISKGEQFLYDGSRFYLQHVSFFLVSALLLAADLIMLYIVLYSFNAGGVTKTEKRLEKLLLQSEKRYYKNSIQYTAKTECTGVLRRIWDILRTGILRHLYRIVSELAILLWTVFSALILFLSVFRIGNWIKCIKWLHRGLCCGGGKDTQYVAYRSAQKKQNIIALSIALLLFVTFFVINRIQNPVPTKEDYMELCGQVIYGNSLDITALLQMGGVPDNSVIEEQLAHITAYENFVKENGALYSDEHFILGMNSLCREDRKCLESLRSYALTGQFPSRNVFENYVKLRGRNYIWLLDEYQEYLKDQVNDALEDIS